MERSTISFWLVVAVLFGASAYFGIHAERDRREFQVAGQPLAEGEQVSLGRVMDGDSLVVVRRDGSKTTVRLVGIKAFDATLQRSRSARFGAQAASELARLLEGKLIVVRLNELPADIHGRTLASLFVEGRDVGLELVKLGLVQVYTRYAFEEMPTYLSAQAAARVERRGLWGDAETAHRADLLARQWETSRK